MWGVEIFDEVCLYFGSKIKMEFIMLKKQNEVVGEKLVVAINGEALRDKIYRGGVYVSANKGRNCRFREVQKMHLTGRVC